MLLLFISSSSCITKPILRLKILFQFTIESTLEYDDRVTLIRIPMAFVLPCVEDDATLPDDR